MARHIDIVCDDLNALRALREEASRRRSDGWIGPIDAAILAAWARELSDEMADVDIPA